MSLTSPAPERREVVAWACSAECSEVGSGCREHHSLLNVVIKPQGVSVSSWCLAPRNLPNGNLRIHIWICLFVLWQAGAVWTLNLLFMLHIGLRLSCAKIKPPHSFFSPSPVVYIHISSLYFDIFKEASSALVFTLQRGAPAACAGMSSVHPCLS